MSLDERETLSELERELAARRSADEKMQRQVALLQAITRLFREIPACESEKEVAQLALKVAEELSGSAIGFIGELNADGRFDTTTLSESGWAACRMPHDQAVELLQNMPNRGINRIGLGAGHPWIINDPGHHPESVQTPPGHPAINSFLGVPLTFRGGITGMIALANKEGGYAAGDQEEIEALMVAFSEALNRRRAERRIGELNKELRHNVQQLEAANKELEAFSYSVSHDLRAPLRHITGFVELLNNRNPENLDAKSRHYLQVISQAAEKMGTLIDDLLSFSRMGRSELLRSRVDLGELVAEVVAELQPQAEGRKIVWQIGKLPVVEGDAAMLRLVLTNYLANALKFTRTRAEAHIAVGANTEQPQETQIFVRDNGVGFDMQYAAKLFGLFQRLHGAGEFEGTGVGLANVRRIIHRHGGRSWAESTPGEGATFWFSLPKAEE